MVKAFSIFACLGALLTMTAQENPTKPTVSWMDHWRKSTFSFGIVDKDQGGRNFFKVIGTGLLMTIDGKTAYIITAKHVFDDPQANWHPTDIRIRFAWQEHQSAYEELGLAIPLKDSNGKVL
jgi:hypothetical protein